MTHHVECVAILEPVAKGLSHQVVTLLREAPIFALGDQAGLYVTRALTFPLRTLSMTCVHEPGVPLWPRCFGVVRIDLQFPG
ncbi:hypothetical protein DRB96_10610 [Streptomyces sp. ICC1]|nr:hypothetical protein DRB89_11745 [Streptomyces sp. ICC4]AWZ12698.1 hypothetical protein DRB96_10610 [Streptomyces sp. ICC1]